jgi:2',3'-cyclic-nucleotide 2'-phosphodiesterase (5'-nucleotidase family)
LTQQEDLKSSFEQGEKFGVTGLEKWRQTERLLMPEEIEALKAAIKEAKEQVDIWIRAKHKSHNK